jgi:signal transduction histidine kinase
MSPAQRARIVRELHDVVAHSISVVGVQAAAADAYLERDPFQAREHLDAVRRTTKEAMAEMRRLSGVLSSAETPPRIPQPTLGQVGDLIAEVRAAGLAVRLVEHGRPPDVPPGVGLAAYRILQEALANVCRHAGAVSATVRIGYRNDRIDLEVTNPADPHRGSPGRGDGIQGMLDRARMYGGSIDAGFAPGGTFAVRARLPL